jgi:hypothetical protein
MASGAAAKAVPQIEPEESGIYESIAVETKAGTFRFREVDGTTYDKCVELATKENDDKQQVTDMVALLRWLTSKSSLDEMDIEKLNSLPFSAREKVLTEVNRMYFPEGSEDLARLLRARGWTVTAPPKDDSGNA